MSDPYNCPFANIDYSFLNVPTADPLIHDTDNLFSLESPHVTFDQDLISKFDMEIEDNLLCLRQEGEREISYIESPYSPNIVIHTETQILPSDVPPGKIRITIEIDDELILKYKKPAPEEKTISNATKEILVSPMDSMTKLRVEGTFEDIPLELQADCKTTLSAFLEKRPGQERSYIEKVLPYLLGSLKEAFSIHKQPVLNKMVFETILKELIYGKEAMIGMDQKVIRNLVNNEIDMIKSYRPMEIGYGDQDLAYRRKDKKIVKGNINNSSVNHMNENYVSNVFKFARIHFPNDKELQHLTSQRGVSATNFRNSMTAQLSDDLFVRKAKVRIIASGQEFINNIEYWMQGGYFENCKDKDKYIQFKHKAVCNLSLDRQY